MTSDGSLSPAARQLERLAQRRDLTATGITEIEAAVWVLIRSGDAISTIASLEQLCTNAQNVSRLWWLLGVALHDAQSHEAALSAMARAVEAAPCDFASSVGVAQLRYETGRPASDAFKTLHARSPDNDDVVRNLSGALAAEGCMEAAEAVLIDRLAERPAWLEGYARLASLRQTLGQDDFDRGYRTAARERPADLALRMGWFQLLAKAKRWSEARDVLSAAGRDLGERRMIVAARLYVASEAGDGEDRADLFADVSVGDPGLAICRVRHALRWGRPDESLEVAQTFDATPSEPYFWPYKSLAWRLLADARAEWMDRPDRFIASFALGLAESELAELAIVLRRLHTMAAPYLDQSVRGGTQTDRPLLFRHEPIIRRTRAAIEEKVRSYVDALPPPEPAHPLLSVSRRELKFAGSWSVRLGAQGFHASHTHPAGWFSSALHIALPPDPGSFPAGYLQFGAPPPELGLDLTAYREIKPIEGTLVLFPSTMWHRTAPFADGERLTIAFDIARPRSQNASWNALPGGRQ